MHSSLIAHTLSDCKKPTKQALADPVISSFACLLFFILLYQDKKVKGIQQGYMTAQERNREGFHVKQLVLD